MLHIQKSNLLRVPADFVCHCANTECIMGAGVALAVKKAWPEAYDADLATKKQTPEEKLGHYSKAELPSGKVVYNLYAQVALGNDGTLLRRNIRYDLLLDSLYRASLDAQEILKEKGKTKGVMAMPWMGCGLAGGDTEIVHSVVRKISLLFDSIDYIICEL